MNATKHLGMLVGLSALLLLSANARTETPPHAECDGPPDALRIVPGPEGAITGWLSLGLVSFARGLDAAAQEKWDPLSLSDENPPAMGARALGQIWQPVIAKTNRNTVSGGQRGVQYFSAEICVPEAQSAWLSVGSDAPFEIYVNRRSLHREPTPATPRDDARLVSLPLQAGTNHLLVRVVKTKAKNPWFQARLLNEQFARHIDVSWVLRGAQPALDALLTQAGRLVIENAIFLESGEATQYAWLDFPGGRPRCSDISARLEATPAFSDASAAVHLPLSSLARTRFLAGVFPLEARALQRLRLDLLRRVSFSATSAAHLATLQELMAAASLAVQAERAGNVPTSSVESVLGSAHQLLEMMLQGTAKASFLRAEVRQLHRFAQQLAQGEDPYANRRGELQRRSYRSRLDGAFHPYALYVPPGYRENASQPFPLVVMLHGLNSTPIKSITSLFGLPLEEGESKAARAQYTGPLKPVNAFVVAPEAFGNSGYYTFGEEDVMDVLRIVRERYPIDENRIYITGASMGGTGAVKLPLHYPDVFAASVPLCGYHDVAAYGSVAGRSRHSFESFLIGEISNVSWVPNGRHLPLYAVHGTRDVPRRSQSLVDRFLHYGYDASLQLLDAGHNVWDEAYADHAIFAHFLGLRRNPLPRRLSFVTWNLRYHQNHWLQLHEMQRYGAMARLDAHWPKNGAISVTTQNAQRFSIRKEAALMDAVPTHVHIDKQRVALSEAGAGDAWHFAYRQGTWQHVDDTASTQRNADCGLRKRPGLAGPLNDAYHEPLLLVYGTGNPDEVAMSRHVLSYVNNPRGTGGVTIRYPVLADVEVRDEDIRNHSLVLVGTPSGNRVLARIQAQLPIRVTGSGIAHNGRQYSGDTMAAAFVYPNPENPNRYVVVHTASTPQGLYYAAHLPYLLPDYLIYDGARWNAQNGLILGADREVAAAGFFDGCWQP
ncbi:MAG: prolyl oligopeptidase family serine peptidase [Myxococcales bacterium]|nr:prolyl oligopeptidase family serine peptidase [Myxococcales bacterium]